MTTEYCTVCGCVVPFCKHTEVKAGPWLRVCITPFGTHITDALHMGSLEDAIEHCKATLKLNPEYTRVQLHEGVTQDSPVVWNSIDQEMAEAAMMMSGIDPVETEDAHELALFENNIRSNTDWWNSKQGTTCETATSYHLIQDKMEILAKYSATLDRGCWAVHHCSACKEHHNGERNLHVMIWKN